MDELEIEEEDAKNCIICIWIYCGLNVWIIYIAHKTYIEQSDDEPRALIGPVFEMTPMAIQ